MYILLNPFHRLTLSIRKPSVWFGAGVMLLTAVSNDWSLLIGFFS